MMVASGMACAKAIVLAVIRSKAWAINLLIVLCMIFLIEEILD